MIDYFCITLNIPGVTVGLRSIVIGAADTASIFFPNDEISSCKINVLYTLILHTIICSTYCSGESIIVYKVHAQISIHLHVQ